MNLDPTVSPWLGIAASTGVCLWMAAIGAPLAHAVFHDRPRLVWPFDAPALILVVHVAHISLGYNSDQHRYQQANIGLDLYWPGGGQNSLSRRPFGPGQIRRRGCRQPSPGAHKPG